MVNGDYLVSKYPAGSLTTLSLPFVWLYCLFLDTISHGESITTSGWKRQRCRLGRDDNVEKSFVAAIEERTRLQWIEAEVVDFLMDVLKWRASTCTAWRRARVEVEGRAFLRLALKKVKRLRLSPAAFP